MEADRRAESLVCSGRSFPTPPCSRTPPTTSPTRPPSTTTSPLPRSVRTLRGKGAASRRKAEKDLSPRFLAGEAGPTAEAGNAGPGEFLGPYGEEAGIRSFDACGSGVSTASSRDWTCRRVLREVRQGDRRAGEAERARAPLRRGGPKFPSLRGIFLAGPGVRRVPPEARGRPRRPPRFWKSIWRTPPRRSGRRSDSFGPRVELEGGRLAEARKEFLEIAESGAHPGTAERAGTSRRGSRRGGDLAGATDRSGVSGVPGTIRSVRRRSSGSPTACTGEGAAMSDRGVLRGGNGGFARWSVPGTGTGRRGRFADTGREAEAAPIFADLGRRRVRRDLRDLRGFGAGDETFRFLNAASTGETKACGEEARTLWARIRKADWGPADAEKVRGGGTADPPRGDRLRRPRGFAGGPRWRRGRRSGWETAGRPASFRYLAGDLKGGINETSNVPLDPAHPGLVDRIQYPLAPEFLAIAIADAPGSIRSSPRGHPPGVAFPGGRPLFGGRRGPDAVDARTAAEAAQEGEDAEAGQAGVAAPLSEYPPRRRGTCHGW